MFIVVNVVSFLSSVFAGMCLFVILYLIGEFFCELVLKRGDIDYLNASDAKKFNDRFWWPIWKVGMVVVIIDIIIELTNK